MKALLVLTLLLAVSACANGPQGDDWCLTTSAIRLTPEEIAALSDASVETILKHNAYGARRCGWRP